MEWASAMRLSVLLGLLANLFVPWGIATTLTPVALLVGVLALVVKVGLLGSVLAAWLAARCGLWFAELRYPEPASPLSVGAVVTRPPVLESVWVVLAQPLGTALAYGAAAAWHGEDDLGRHTA